MNIKLLALLLWGALVIPTEADGVRPQIHQITSLARFPLAVTANFLKTKNRKVGYIVSALTNAVRLVDNSLSIANGANKYNVFLTGYDLVRCGTDIVIAFSDEQPDMELSTPVTNSIMTNARKILLPLVEAGAAFYAASSNIEDLTRVKAQSISTFAQLLSDYFDSEANSTESKLLLACLIINGIGAGYDFTVAQNENQQQPGEGYINIQVGDINNDDMELIEREQEQAEEERIRNLRNLRNNGNNHNPQPILNTQLSTIHNQLEAKTIPKDDSCSICSHEWVRPLNNPKWTNYGGNVLVTNCQNNAHHVYHVDCLNKWAESRRTEEKEVKCPVCNFVLEPVLLDNEN
jgi:hypothetical protein